MNRVTTVDVQIADHVVGAPGNDDVSRWVEATIDAAQCDRNVEVSVCIVGEEEGRTLNREFRDKDYATNVLSFGAGMKFADMPEDWCWSLGDVVLCAPVVAREAIAQSKREADHWAHLIVHGTLHLLGHDHVDAADAGAMESLEVEVLESLGIADPYAVR